MPAATATRYLVEKKRAGFESWRFSDKIRSLTKGKNLRIEVFASATLHWSTDNWQTTHDTETRDTKLGVYVVDLPAEQLPPGGSLVFTFRWTDSKRWEGRNFDISL